MPKIILLPLLVTGALIGFREVVHRKLKIQKLKKTKKIEDLWDLNVSNEDKK